MNRVYKIVWSKTKNAYVVTSEVARSHTKSASGKAVKAALAAAMGMGVLMGGYVADAAPATNPSGDGPGIAIGTGSSSQKVDSTAVGKNAKTTGESALAEIKRILPRPLPQRKRCSPFTRRAAKA